MLPLDKPSKGHSDPINVVSGGQKGELPPISAFMDTRLPYNTEYVMGSLLRLMVAKGLITLTEAQWIMKSGESYLH